MNIFKSLLVISVGIITTIAHGSYTHKQATSDDIQAIVELMNNHAAQDAMDKIVIVPKIFREDYVRNGVETGRFFVTYKNNIVIAYKKLFCITDNQERNDILTSELRLNTPAVAVGKFFTASHQMISDNSLTYIFPNFFTDAITILYTGTDYVHPDMRTHGINVKLTTYALHSSIKTILRDIDARKSTYIALVYGLTQENADREDNLMGGRTGNIIKIFESFMSNQLFEKGFEKPTEYILTRHCSFKPSFAVDSEECKPLPDDKSVPGYGCALIAALLRKV